MYCVVEITQAKKSAVIPLKWVKGFNSHKIRYDPIHGKPYTVFISKNVLDQPEFSPVLTTTPETFLFQRGAYKGTILYIGARAAAVSSCNSRNAVNMTVKLEKTDILQKRALATMHNELQLFQTTIVIDDDDDDELTVLHSRTPVIHIDDVAEVNMEQAIENDLQPVDMIQNHSAAAGPSGGSANTDIRDATADLPQRNGMNAHHLVAAGPSAESANAGIRDATADLSQRNRMTAHHSAAACSMAGNVNAIMNTELGGDEFAGIEYGFWIENHIYRIYKLETSFARIKTFNVNMLERYNSKKNPYLNNAQLYDVRYLVILVQEIYHEELDSASGILTLQDVKNHVEYFGFIKRKLLY